MMTAKKGSGLVAVFREERVSIWKTIFRLHAIIRKKRNSLAKAEVAVWNMMGKAYLADNREPRGIKAELENIAAMLDELEEKVGHE